MVPGFWVLSIVASVILGFCHPSGFVTASSLVHKDSHHQCHNGLGEWPISCNVCLWWAFRHCVRNMLQISSLLPAMVAPEFSFIHHRPSLSLGTWETQYSCPHNPGKSYSPKRCFKINRLSLSLCFFIASSSFFLIPLWNIEELWRKNGDVTQRQSTCLTWVWSPALKK